MKKPVIERGLLVGIPVPIKDLDRGAGALTQSSPIDWNDVSARSGLLLGRIPALRDTAPINPRAAA